MLAIPVALIGAFVIAWTTSRNDGTREAGLMSWVPLAAYMALLSLIAVVTTFLRAGNPGARP